MVCRLRESNSIVVGAMEKGGWLMVLRRGKRWEKGAV
jgi:hypothetical protein